MYYEQKTYESPQFTQFINRILSSRDNSILIKLAYRRNFFVLNYSKYIVNKNFVITNQ